MSDASSPARGAVDLPTLVAERSFATWRAPDGTRDALGADEALRRARAQPPVLCHGPATVSYTHLTLPTIYSV